VTLDLFKFEGTTFSDGQPILGATSVQWTERYRKECEFTIVAPVSSGLKEFLPEGTFISHVDTREIMVVENHEINENKDSEIIVTITGRSLETFLENRVIGQNRAWPWVSGAALPEYILPSQVTWLQARTLIEDHILPASVVNTADGLSNVEISTDVSVSGTSEERKLARGPVFPELLKILEVDNLGIKSLRPNKYTNNNAKLIIHSGADKTLEVAFSYEEGEVESARYLWSIKALKNAALVSGKWVETMVNGGETGFNRRVMFVNATDIDEAYEATPTGADLTSVLAQMNARGVQELARQNYLNLADVGIVKNTTRYTYRNDYELGDLVAVNGNYNANSVMRVVEFVEFEDESGYHTYPTLEAI
jgi:hypothetical protein